MVVDEESSVIIRRIYTNDRKKCVYSMRKDRISGGEAKEYHPDLHPNDPRAAEKMNEINEAYDMLSNPEKYQKREQSGAGYGNHSYGGYQQRNTYGGNTNQGYGSQGNFWGFDFDDIFGFGERTRPLQKPSRLVGLLVIGEAYCFPDRGMIRAIQSYKEAIDKMK